MGPAFRHEPVMGREVVELLGVVPPGLVVDATVGGGGHARLLLEARPDFQLLGIDRDPDAVEAARAELAPFGDRVRVVHGGFEDIAEIVASESEGNIMGILFDLGVSSPQLDRGERGFSYWGEAPLDMRMDGAQTLTAAQVVNEYDEERLAALIAENGEERFAREIAQRIVACRPLETTADLVDAVKEAIPAPARRRGGHPARRTFQAIRMEVNRELPNLAEGLDESVHLLKPEGRVLVLAYHSLEDRLVKERFTALAETVEPAPPGLPVEPERRPGLLRILTRRARRPPRRRGRREPACQECPPPRGRASRPVRVVTQSTTITAPRTRPRPPVRARASAPTRGRSGSAAAATARPLPARTAPAPHERPARRPLRVVEPDRRRRLFRTRRLVVLGTTLTLATVLTVVAFHVMLAQGQVRLDGLQREMTVAERAYEQARVRAGPRRVAPAHRLPRDPDGPRRTRPAADPDRGPGRVHRHRAVVGRARRLAHRQEEPR